METFPCPYLGGIVELTDERERHIVEKHSTLLPDRPDCIAAALSDPDLIRRAPPPDDSIRFCRWFYDLDKYTVVAVVRDPGVRHWIVTAYITRRPPAGATLWQRS